MNLKAIHDNLSDKIKSDIKVHDVIDNDNIVKDVIDNDVIVRDEDTKDINDNTIELK